MGEKTELVDMTAEIVSAYVGNNTVGAGELPALIQDVYAALTEAIEGGEEARAGGARPAVAVRKSVTEDHLVCLECGKSFKSLKRHLRTHHNLSPDQYRSKWELGKDYPMVAPRYASARSNLAKQMGLGQKKTASKRRR